MYSLNLNNLTNDQKDFLDELEGYFDSKDEMLAAIKEDSGRLSNKLSDTLTEMADSNVSVYTYDQIEFLLKHLAEADQEEAVACGAKTAQEIAAYCWFMINQKNYAELINKIREDIQETN